MLQLILTNLLLDIAPSSICNHLLPQRQMIHSLRLIIQFLPQVCFYYLLYCLIFDWFVSLAKFFANPFTDEYDGKFHANPNMSFVSLMQGDKDANNLDAGLTYAFESYSAGSRPASYQQSNLSTHSYNTLAMPDGFDKIQEFKGNPGWQVLLVTFVIFVLYKNFN